MKFKISILLFSFLIAASYSSAQNPLDTMEWAPPLWTEDQGKAGIDNLVGLLSLLENEAAQNEQLWFMESHFSSVKILLEAYPPASTIIDGMIDVYSNYQGAGSLSKYLLGNQQLLLAYTSENTGVVSYVVYTLPEDFNPEIAYPLYTWGTEGGPTTYPGGIYTQFEGQVTGGSLHRGPSSRFKDGYTIIPGGLGQRSYTGDCAADFFQGMDLFISKFRTDRRKYYLGGFSNGGRATWLLSTAVGSMEKYRFAALAMFAANVDASYVTGTYSSRISEASIWLGAGKLDGTYLPKARFINSHLMDVGHSPEVYLEAEGVGHEWTYAIQDSMCNFLQKKEFLWPGDVPDAPSDLTYSELSENQVVLTWTDHSNSELYFVVERKNVQDDNFKKLGVTGPDREEYMDTGLTPGTEYVYRVYAYNESGDSDFSTPLTLTTEGATLFNVAEGKDVTVLDKSSMDVVGRLVDGNPSTDADFRWSANGFPQTVTIDLGNNYDISIFKIYAFESRDYLYTIHTRLDGEEFKLAVDRTTNTGASVYTDEVNVTARYVKLIVTGAYTYTGTWISIGELEAFGKLSENLVINVTGVELTESEISIAVDSTYQLTADIFPSNATDQSVEWSTGNPGIATVDQSGVVTGHSPGQASIRVVSRDGGLRVSCTVDVFDVTGIAPSPQNQDLINAYPSPAKDFLILELDPDFLKKEGLENLRTSIYSSMGREIAVFPYDGRAIDLTGLEVGFYIISVSSDKNMASFRFIKE